MLLPKSVADVGLLEKMRMKDTERQAEDNPMEHPEEQPGGTDAPFRLGRLLLLLSASVLLIGLIAILAGAYFT